VTIKQVTLNKWIFITENYFPKHTKIATKLKGFVLLTKVIRKTSKEAWVLLDRESD
jgi:hypothetical protein